MLSIGAAVQSNTPGAFGTILGTVLSTPTISVPKDAVLALILATMWVALDAATTAVLTTITRNVTAGAVNIGINNAEVAAGGTFRAFQTMCVDLLTGQGTVQYSLRASGTASVGNNNPQAASIAVIFLQ